MKLGELEEVIPMVCICKHCGENFEVFRRGSKFCGVNCRVAFGRKLKKHENK